MSTIDMEDMGKKAHALLMQEVFEEMIKKMNISDDKEEIDPIEDIEDTNEIESQDVMTNKKNPNESPKASAAMITDNTDKLIESFNNYAKDQGWDEGTYAAVKQDNGMISVEFPSEEDAVAYMKYEAQNGERFEVYEVSDDEQRKLVAYSNGDGKLYLPDGKELTEDAFPGDEPEIANQENEIKLSSLDKDGTAELNMDSINNENVIIDNGENNEITMTNCHNNNVIIEGGSDNNKINITNSSGNIYRC